LISEIKNICVFASSSDFLDKVYYETARELGLLIGEYGYNIVYGGSQKGLMFACAGAVKERGGKICGIMPKRIADFGCANPDDCDEFILTEGMRERKALLDDKSDAVIALAGGFGTLEELSEMIVQKQLGYCKKPIIILNTNGFYDKLIEFFEVMISNNFASKNSRDLYFVAETPLKALEFLKNYKAVEFGSKYLIQN